MSSREALQERTSISTEIIEKVLLDGDLAKLSPDQRLSYYNKMCESTGLNPLTKPFAYIRLNGQLRLYAQKDATDQLRKLHGVSITNIVETGMEDVHIVTAHAQDATGRTDVDQGAVKIGNLSGDALANALLKTVTKAKRRVTLSICGLSMLDETEVETIPDAVVVDDPPVDVKAEVVEEDKPPYFRYLEKCQEMKSLLGEERYYIILKDHKLEHSNDIDSNDTRGMNSIVKDLLAENEAIEAEL